MREFLRRSGGKDIAARALRARIMADMSPRQQGWLADESAAKAGCCGRRAGKTVVNAADLTLDAMRVPERGEMCAYITLTRKNAKLLLWPELKRFNAKYGIGIKFNNTDLLATFPSGGSIWLGGADTEDQIEKFRGFKFRRIVLDECASFAPHINALIDEVLHPALLDVSGKMSMIGSPSAKCSGAFYDACTDPSLGWSLHQWTVLENPAIPNAAAWLASECARKGLSEDDPRYLREWMGRWVADLNSLVYRYQAANSDYDVLPSGHDWEYVLGVDLGFDPDPCAFVVLAFCRDLPDVYVVETEQLGQLIPEAIANRVKAYMGRYRFARIVADTGGLGKAIVEEMRQRYSIPVYPAEKRNKHEYIELLNSDLATGRMRIRRQDPLAHDWQQLVWDMDTRGRRKESDRYPNHRSDAALYAWREAKHFAYKAPDVPPAIGTDAHAQREAARLERQAQARLRQKQSAA